MWNTRRNCRRWVYSAWRKEGLWKVFLLSYCKVLQLPNERVEQRCSFSCFLQEHSNSTKGDEHKLQHQKLWVVMRDNKKFTMSMVKIMQKVQKGDEASTPVEVQNVTWKGPEQTALNWPCFEQWGWLETSRGHFQLQLFCDFSDCTITCPWSTAEAVSLLDSRNLSYIYIQIYIFTFRLHQTDWVPRHIL